MRSDRHDTGFGRWPCAGAQPFGGLDPPHDRHGKIHQHQIKGLFFRRLYALCPIFRQHHRMAILAQHFPQNKLVDRVIFNHQHAQRPPARRPHRRRGAGAVVGLHCPRQGQAHPKHAALAQFAFHTDRAAHGLHDTPSNAQAQPRALRLHALWQIKAHEIIKNAVNLGFGNANAGITHLYFHHWRRIWRWHNHLDQDLAGFGVFHRIA